MSRVITKSHYDGGIGSYLASDSEIAAYLLDEIGGLCADDGMPFTEFSAEELVEYFAGTPEYDRALEFIERDHDDDLERSYRDSIRDSDDHDDYVRYVSSIR